MIKNLLLTLFLIGSFSLPASSSENRTSHNINLSLGEDSFTVLNISRDSWKEDRLQYGLETNFIKREVYSLDQNVFDFKIYTGWNIFAKKEISIDLRVGYGVNMVYYPLDKTKDYGYAPVIGTKIQYEIYPKWILSYKMMCSFYQDGVAMPYLFGVNRSISNKISLFLGTQGMYSLNIEDKITTNFEIGFCIGIEL